MAVTGIMRQILVIGANLGLVAAVTLLILADLVPLALALVLISKWQMLLGGVRSWWPNLKSNACDLVVGLSFVILISLPELIGIKLALAGLYLFWLVVIKPLSSPGWVGIQAATCQFLGLVVLFLFARIVPGLAVIAASWLLAYIAASHFLSTQEEAADPLVVAGWSLLVAEAAWLFWHWLVTYNLAGGQLLLPQIAIVVTVIGYFFGRIYLDHVGRILSRRRLVEYIVVCLLIVGVIAGGTEWNVRI